MDTFVEYQDINYTDTADVNRFKQLKLQASLSPAEALELNALAAKFVSKVPSAYSFNHLSDAIVGIENHYIGEQQAWQQIKDEALGLIDGINQDISDFHNGISVAVAALHAQYNAMFATLEIQGFSTVNTFFDDWSVKRGCEYTHTVVKSGGKISQINSVIKVTFLNFNLAESMTVINRASNGDINSVVETVTFHPWQNVDGSRIVDFPDFTIKNTTDMTQYKTNGVIKESIT